MQRLVGTFALTLILELLATLGMASAQTAPGCPPAPGPDGQINLAGNTKLNTRPFDLEAGNYLVRWSGSMKGQFGGNLIMTMKRADGQFFLEGLVNLILNKNEPSATGETYVSAVKPVTYYIDILAPG